MCFAFRSKQGIEEILKGLTQTDLDVLQAEVTDVAWVSIGEMQTERSNLGFSPGGQRRGSKLCLEKTLWGNSD